MKKLALQPEELRVESFRPQPPPAATHGTVHGRVWTYEPEECTCYGHACGTTAPPGQACACIPYSNDVCSVFTKLGERC